MYQMECYVIVFLIMHDGRGAMGEARCVKKIPVILHAFLNLLENISAVVTHKIFIPQGPMLLSIPFTLLQLSFKNP